MNPEPDLFPPETTSTATEADPRCVGEGVVSFVLGLRKSDAHRGTLAVLRGALSSSEERQIRAYRLLAPYGGIPETHPHRAEVVRTMAGLMTLSRMRVEQTKKNFGYSCRKLLSKEERKTLTKPTPPGPVGRRMQHLLAASREEVCERVSALARRIANADGNVNFLQLYRDLYDWGPSVKAKWAGAFWGSADETKNQSKEDEEE